MEVNKIGLVFLLAFATFLALFYFITRLEESYRAKMNTFASWNYDIDLGPEFFEAEVEASRRRDQVDTECSLSSDRWRMDDPSYDYTHLSRNPQLLRHIIVDDEHKILFCYIPKIACTNWKRLLLLWSGKTKFEDPNQIPGEVAHERDNFDKLSEFKPDEIIKRLETYRKFLFVRHPLERLVSAFRNKFEKSYKSAVYFKKRFGANILRKYRKNATAEDLESGSGVKFSEFVTFLIDSFFMNVKYDKNEHWNTYSELCSPCEVRYDLIGKYDSLAKDAKFILAKLGSPPHIKFPEVIPSKTSSYIDSYVNSLSYRQKLELFSIYRMDFDLFGYHYKKYL